MITIPDRGPTFVTLQNKLYKNLSLIRLHQVSIFPILPILTRFKNRLPLTALNRDHMKLPCGTT